MFWVVGKTFAEKTREQKGERYDSDIRKLKRENERLRLELEAAKGSRETGNGL